MPSAICYEQTAPAQWSEYFCLVNPTCCTPLEDEASATAESDLKEAFAARNDGGSDREVAEVLRQRGYVKVDGVRRAQP